MSDFITPEEVERYRDEHALQCERFAMLLEGIDEGGSVDGFNTHQVAAADLEMLRHRITAVGLGMTEAQSVDRHAKGEPVLDEQQRVRAAILYSVASLITEAYDADLDKADPLYGQVARFALRGNGISLLAGEKTAPALTIASSDTQVLRQRGSLLHNWTARILTKVHDDPYYEKFWP